MKTETEKRSTESPYNYFVAAVIVHDFKVARSRHFTKLAGPFSNRTLAEEYHRIAVDRAAEIGQHPADISVIGRRSRAKGILNSFYGINNDK